MNKEHFKWNTSENNNYLILKYKDVYIGAIDLKKNREDNYNAHTAYFTPFGMADKDIQSLQRRIQTGCILKMKEHKLLNKLLSLDEDEKKEEQQKTVLSELPQEKSFTNGDSVNDEILNRISENIDEISKIIWDMYSDRYEMPSLQAHPKISKDQQRDDSVQKLLTISTKVSYFKHVLKQIKEIEKKSLTMP